MTPAVNSVVAPQFVHLHLHTQYSLLDGANKLPEVLELAHKMGHPAIAITDHGNMHGAIEFYTHAKKIGIKPIIGCELYVTGGSRFERKMKNQGGAETHHLTVLAQNLTGYRNLCRLVSLAYKEGFYFKPRVDHELLSQYSEGLIVLSGCLAGELSGFLLEDNLKAAQNLLEFYLRTFKDRFYLEVQPHQIIEQQKLNLGCAEFAKQMGVPLVASTDCHYPTKDDHHAQEVLMCISTGKQITDPTRLRHEGFSLYLKSAQDMLAEMSGLSYAEEALRNSVEIAKSVDLSFDFSKHFMPSYAPSKADGDRPLITIMAEKARNGLLTRLETIFSDTENCKDEITLRSRYNERLETEISLIEKMGFAGYFLVVSDFIVWAKEQGIPVGPGRGSVAGSLVAFAMRITEVDPIPHKLIFERFLNPERVSLPDIDVDFCINGRDRVIKYVIERYGKEKVSQIATFGTLKAKAALKDVGRALGVSYAETDRIAQLVPAPRQGFDYPLTEALKMEPRLAEYAAGDGKEVIRLALKLEGLTRHVSTHAAGVVIGDRPLIELLPMMVDKSGNDVTQYSMTYVEKIGLVKFDFLGLRTLTMLHTAVRIIKESRGIKINLTLLPLNDPKTYKLLCSGNTTGVFQLESSGITEMTMRLKPNGFDDLVAILALYRPGPLDAGMVDHYIDRKHGREKVSYLHPNMAKVLSDTYGIMVYQEQIMQLARELAGYSLAEADILRKAMGKKNPEEMAKQRERFSSGATERKIEARLANEIFDQMETFARYGFNRSHSAAYAMVSFQTAFLKAHYPVEFLAALLSHEMDDSDKVVKNLNECKRQKIAVVPPDINESSADFSVRKEKILYGLAAVKGIGEKAVQVIVEARKDTPFVDLPDFARRVDLGTVNRRVLEGLIKCGAFDSCSSQQHQLSRRAMVEALDDVLRAAVSLNSERNTNQISLFGAQSPAALGHIEIKAISEWPVNQKLAFERDALGFYLTGHPLAKFASDMARFGLISISDLKSKKRSLPEVRVAGVITALKLKNTKKGDRYASFVFEDSLATIESLVWPDTYRKVATLIVADEPVLVTGKLDIGEERCSLIVNAIESLTDLRDKRAKLGLLSLSSAEGQEAHIRQVVDVFGRHKGTCPVKVRLEVDGAEVTIDLRDVREAQICVVPSEALCEEVEQVFGRPVLSFV